MPETPNKASWYAVKVFYNKVFDMEDILAGMGLETYLPADLLELRGAAHMNAAKKIASVPPGSPIPAKYVKQGPVIYERKPMISSLIFVKAEEEAICEVDARLRRDAEFDRLLGFIYKTADWKDFAKIPEKQMESFRLVTMKGSEGLDFFADDDISRYATGDKVRVVEGPLKGAEGYIKRIKKDRRLLVCVQGIIAVASSYIPMQMLEKVEDA